MIQLIQLFTEQEYIYIYIYIIFLFVFLFIYIFSYQANLQMWHLIHFIEFIYLLILVHTYAKYLNIKQAAMCIDSVNIN